MATSKPLRIQVTSGVSPEIVDALRAKGHEVDWLPTSTEQCDLILGPTCARFLPGMEQFLDSFIKGARAVRYGKVKA
jgi:hypothetical protein